MKIPKLIEVKSTNLKAIGHDGSSLFIRFRWSSEPDRL